MLDEFVIRYLFFPMLLHKSTRTIIILNVDYASFLMVYENQEVF